MTYKFTVKRKARSGSTPPCKGWTYHHVLPWRYYYFLSAILSYYYIAVLIANKQIILNEIPVGYHDDISKTVSLNKIFGTDVVCDSTIFRYMTDMQLVDFSECLFGLDRTPTGLIHDILLKFNSDNTTIVKHGTSPIFGGFPGVDGSQRTDDPGHLREKTKPLNGNNEWWVALDQIGSILETATASKITLINEPELSFNLSDDNVDSLIHSLRVLVLNYNKEVLPFDDNSWGMNFHGVDGNIKLSPLSSGCIYAGKSFYVKKTNNPLAVTTDVMQVNNKLYI